MCVLLEVFNLPGEIETLKNGEVSILHGSLIARCKVTRVSDESNK